ncbi:hydantoinase/oxoprolinase family protein [Pelagibacterium sp.]|uniref:hydantoinase/oxoprolinase family protein n=1 Tax=Pelagibacterium sp. TaxID=1967288 RepID=UPI003A8F7581
MTSNNLTHRDANTLRVSVDIGGTFTDLVGYDATTGALSFSKSLTTYEGLSNGVFDCIRLAEIDVSDVSYFIHGSTIAINTVIQRKGARTGLITTKGFRDVYAIGRGSRPEAYNLMLEKLPPLVQRENIFEVDERLNAAGSVVVELNESDVAIAVDALVAQGVESIAVALLHAYANPIHEKRIGEIIAERAPQLYVSLSHEILREFREYERTSTTVLNSFVGPIIGEYLGELESSLTSGGFAGHFLIMQSNGGTMSSETAVEKPVAMMESGPVAGVIGCARLGQALGQPNVISFDMGGTTAKSSLIENNEVRIVTGYHIGASEGLGHPMMLPVVDIVEVGTGGGSIAWIDPAGGLKVGPISAGSAPGPVCYGKGGNDPTITDANLVLGRLDAGNFLGGQMNLDLEGARRAIDEKIARPLGLSVEEAALGIIKIADTKMSLTVREVSVQKGHDPRGFAMIATGGAGPLHAVSIARELSLPTVVIPELPGTFSALGMLMSDVRHDFVRTMILQMKSAPAAIIENVFVEMADEANQRLAADGVRSGNGFLTRGLDLRYEGQEYTLTIPVTADVIDSAALEQVREKFDELHRAQYGHDAPEESVEIVNLRLAAIGTMGEEPDVFGQPITTGHERTGRPKGRRTVHFEEGEFECDVFDRGALIPDQIVTGPAIIEERVSTTVVLPGATAKLDSGGSIIISVEGN